MADGDSLADDDAEEGVAMEDDPTLPRTTRRGYVMRGSSTAPQEDPLHVTQRQTNEEEVMGAVSSRGGSLRAVSTRREVDAPADDDGRSAPPRAVTSEGRAGNAVVSSPEAGLRGLGRLLSDPKRWFRSEDLEAAGEVGDCRRTVGASAEATARGMPDATSSVRAAALPDASEHLEGLSDAEGIAEESSSAVLLDPSREPKADGWRRLFAPGFEPTTRADTSALSLSADPLDALSPDDAEAPAEVLSRFVPGSTGNGPGSLGSPMPGPPWEPDVPEEDAGASAAEKARILRSTWGAVTGGVTAIGTGAVTGVTTAVTGVTTGVTAIGGGLHTGVQTVGLGVQAGVQTVGMGLQTGVQAGVYGIQTIGTGLGRAAVGTGKVVADTTQTTLKALGGARDEEAAELLSDMRAVLLDEDSGGTFRTAIDWTTTSPLERRRVDLADDVTTDMYAAENRHARSASVSSTAGGSVDGLGSYTSEEDEEDEEDARKHFASAETSANGGGGGGPGGFKGPERDPVASEVKVIGTERVRGRLHPSGGWTVYVLRVTPSGGGDPWVVKRRYGEFVRLRLGLVGSGAGEYLPASWAGLETESGLYSTGTARKARRELISRCFQEAMTATTGSYNGFAEHALVRRFLRRDEPGRAASATNEQRPIWQRVGLGGILEAVTRTGASASGAAASAASDAAYQQSRERVRLLLDRPLDRSVNDALRAQEGCCAGCGDPLNGFGSGTLVSKGTALLRAAVGNGFRRCEYSGGLYCPRCQPGDAVSVLPYSVVHDWDFTPRRVSAAAKAYLDAIHHQPMLCLGAVNPGLYARVPLLAELRARRYRLAKLVGVLAGSEPGTALVRSTGRRAYLLEAGEYYAMADLVDVSKGAAFARLPGWLEEVEKKAAALVAERTAGRVSGGM